MSLIRRRPPADPIDPDDRSPELGVRYRDLVVMHQLAIAGADLTEPRHVSYYIYFPSEETAGVAGARVNEELFSGSERRVDVHPTPVPGSATWSVVFETVAVIDPTNVVTADDYLRSLAEELGGEYDGWEASVVTMTKLPAVSV